MKRGTIKLQPTKFIIDTNQFVVSANSSHFSSISFRILQLFNQIVLGGQSFFFNSSIIKRHLSHFNVVKN